jgi:hypothetical protein
VERGDVEKIAKMNQKDPIRFDVSEEMLKMYSKKEIHPGRNLSLNK